ncbi:hypothetical protein DFH28DRAFT_862788, partial [Melampsora americana]
MDTLGLAAEKSIKHIRSLPYTIRPFLVLDNIDIQACVHNPCIESTTKMFHGSYGYLHVLPDHLVKDMDPAEANVNNLLKYVRQSQAQPFKISYLLPNEEESIHWTCVLKSQLSEALLNHVLKKDSPGYVCSKKEL